MANGKALPRLPPPHLSAHLPLAPPPAVVPPMDTADATLPDATLSALVAALAEQYRQQSGRSPHPVSGERSANPVYARYTRGLLHMLATKTAGNRSPDEDQLINAILSEIG